LGRQWIWTTWHWWKGTTTFPCACEKRAHLIQSPQSNDIKKRQTRKKKIKRFVDFLIDPKHIFFHPMHFVLKCTEREKKKF
jgi:hypothetical protein